MTQVQSILDFREDFDFRGEVTMSPFVARLWR